MAARKARARPRRKGKAAGKRRPAAVLVAMVALAAALIWGVVALSQRGQAPFRFAAPEDEHAHDTEITDDDRQRLREVLESIDRGAEKQ
jgi:hypothetical protein